MEITMRISEESWLSFIGSIILTRYHILLKANAKEVAKHLIFSRGMTCVHGTWLVFPISFPAEPDSLSGSQCSQFLSILRMARKMQTPPIDNIKIMGAD